MRAIRRSVRLIEPEIGKLCNMGTILPEKIVPGHILPERDKMSRVRPAGLARSSWSPSSSTSRSHTHRPLSHPLAAPRRETFSSTRLRPSIPPTPSPTKGGVPVPDLVFDQSLPDEFED